MRQRRNQQHQFKAWLRERNAQPLIVSFWTTWSISPLSGVSTGVPMAMSCSLPPPAFTTSTLILHSHEAATHTLYLDSWSMDWASQPSCCLDLRPTQRASSSAPTFTRKPLIPSRCPYWICLIGWFSQWPPLIKSSSMPQTNKHLLLSLAIFITRLSTIWPGSEPQCSCLVLQTGTAPSWVWKTRSWLVRDCPTSSSKMRHWGSTTPPWTQLTTNDLRTKSKTKKATNSSPLHSGKRQQRQRL